jgi:hypothetical protein
VTSNIEIGGRLKFDTNVFVDTLRVADVAANIVTYDRTTGELLDSSGTFMNKFAVVSEQPPSDFFANTTTVTNHGSYTLTTSNLATNSNTYNAFDGTANAWVSGGLAGGYIGGSNVFHENNLTQLSNLHPTQRGDWLAIEFPYKTTLRHMKLTPLTAAQFPASANIYATNNDLTWTEINYWSGRDPVTASNVQTITVNATEQFKKYALVATKAAGNSSNVALQDWQLFTESFSIDGGKVAMAQQAATGGETVMDQHGPHSRNPKAVPLKKYPEIVFEKGKFDSNDSTNTYIQAGYTVTVSGFVNSSNHPWKAFNGTDYEVGMLLSGLNYDTNGNANTSGTTASRLSASDSTPYGEWLKLELPNKIKLDKYVFTSRNDATHWTQSVEAGQVWGSNNDSNWVHLHTFTNSGFTGESQSASFNVQTDNYYKYYAFIVTKTFATGSDYYLCIPELEYYGYEEDPPAGDTSVDTTFTSIMNTPQTTGAQVYVDGSLGGNANTNRVVGPAAANTAATYDTTGKYWELNGTLTSNISVEANTFLSGDAPHSLSMWFNSSNLVSNASNSCIFSLGTEERLDHVSAAFSNTYQTVQKITAGSRSTTNANFGNSCAINSDGTRMIVGAYFEDNGGTNYGAVYIYTYSNGKWDNGVRIGAPTPVSGTADQAFGVSVAMNSAGTRVVVGAHYDDTGANDAGAAYVYSYSNGSWTLDTVSGDATGRIQASDKAASDRFGFSVAMSGDGTRIIVGRTANFTSHTATGAAYIYTYSSGSWGSEKKLTASDAQANDNFGASVAMTSDGTKVVVGAPFEDTGGSNYGKVYTYIYNSGSDSWAENSQKLQATSFLGSGSGGSDIAFGSSVSMNSDGTKMIVGAHFEDTGTGGVSTNDSGSAYIYTYSGGSWGSEVQLQASDVTAAIADGHDDEFGWCVRMSSDGTTVIVGVRFEDQGSTDSGAAYIFAYDGSNWGDVAKLKASDGATIDHFGFSVAISGDGKRVIVGADGDDDPPGSSSGSVYVYDRDTTHHLTTDLKLQSNTWHNLTYAYQGEGGSRVTYLDGRKVAEDQAEDTFGDYPPFAMTGYSQGGYVVSSNHTRSGYHPYDAFDNETNDDDTTSSRWWSSADVFSGNVYNGSTSDHCGTFQGVYLKLELPYKLICSHVNLWFRDFNGAQTPNSQSPKDFKIVGSNDDINWVELKDEVSFVDTGNVAHPVIVNATKGYKYLAIVVTRVNSSTLVSIMDIEYYGHRENDLVRLPDPTNVLKYPHIAMTTETTTVQGPKINPGAPGDRGYEIIYSNHGGTPQLPSRVFDGNTDATVGSYGWMTSGYTYDVSSGAFPGTSGASYSLTIDGTSRSGSWVGIKMLRKLKVTSVVYYPRIYTGYSHGWEIQDGYIVGSNDGISWDSLLTISGETGWTASPKTFTMNNNLGNYYQYFAILATKVQANNTVGRFAIQELEFYGTEEATSIPIQIGGGNIDKVANFRVYDKFIGEDQALEIWDAQKDEFGRAKSSMTLQKGRLGIGTDEPQGRLAVADEPDATTYGLQEFPPKPLVGYKTYMEGHGEFCVSATSIHTTSGGWHPYYAFDKKDSSMSYMTWESGFNDYASAAPHNYGGNFSLGGYFGEYIDFKMPYSIKLNNYSVSMNGSWSYYGPKDFMILASNDNKTWDQIHLVSGQIWASSSKPETINYNVNDTKYYNHFALLVTALAGNARRVNIAEIKFFGYREQVTKQSVLHDGQLTLTKSLNVPRIGPPLDADDTPRRDRLVVEYNTSTNPTFEGAVRDTSGRGNDGVFRGSASYDATEKAFDIVSSSDIIFSGREIGGVSGDILASVSLWFKAPTLTGGSQILFIHTSAYAARTSFVLNLQVNEIRVGHGGTNYTYNAGSWLPGTWYHAVGIKRGTGAIQSDIYDLYLNGVKLALTNAAGTQAMVMGTNQSIIIGSARVGGFSEQFTGEISNVKYYPGLVLTAEEVKTLYDMGRLGNGLYPLHIDAPVYINGPLYAPGSILNISQFVDDADREVVSSTSQVTGYTTPPIHMKAGSKVKLDFLIPWRHDGADLGGNAWRGGYHWIYFRLNKTVAGVAANTFVLLLSSGYHMGSGASFILTYSNSCYLPLSVPEDYTIEFQHRFAAYMNTSTPFRINTSHHINGSADANLLKLGFPNTNMGWSKYIITEISK